MLLARTQYGVRLSLNASAGNRSSSAWQTIQYFCQSQELGDHHRSDRKSNRRDGSRSEPPCELEGRARVLQSVRKPLPRYERCLAQLHCARTREIRRTGSSRYARQRPRFHAEARDAVTRIEGRVLTRPSSFRDFGAWIPSQLLHVASSA